MGIFYGCYARFLEIILLLKTQTAKQCSKHKHQRMSSNNGKSKELSTKEEKMISSTLFLLQDNKLKLGIVSKLKKARSTIEGLEFYDNTNLDLI